MPEWVYVAMLGINTVSLLVVLAKLVWGSGVGLQTQFHTLERNSADSISALRLDCAAKFDAQSANIGNVIANVGNRIHDLELKAMEFRAIAAETYMRRDSYHKATDEFKRDVRTSHDDLKTDMNAGFKELRDQIDAVSQSIEAGRKSSRSS